MMGSISASVNPKFNGLQDMLKERAQSKSPGSLMLYSFGNTSTPTQISYSDLYTQAKDISFIIRSLEGFEEGCPILLHFNDHWDTILWFWGVLLATGLPTISSPFSNVDDHRQKQVEGISKLLKGPICITRAQSLPIFGGNCAIQLHTIESLLNRKPREDGMPLAGTRIHKSGKNAGYFVEQHDVLAMLMFTSGSTGGAKAVSITHGQILAAIAGKASVRALPSNLPFLNWIGLDHVASLVEIHLQAIWLGVSQVHVHAADVVSSPETYLEILSRHRVSRSFVPNFFLARLASMSQSKYSANWDLSSLVVLASGGEANDVKTCVAAAGLLEKYGAPRNVITPGFGMTETCAGAIFNLDCPQYDVENNLTVASVGKCMDGIEMRVTVLASEISESTKLASPNEPGDLEVRGDAVFRGYYCNVEATASAFTSDGWFRTGDRAMIDSAGKLNLMGRIHETININGVKLVAADIQSSVEQAVGAHVARLVCFASRGAHTEQITVAYEPRNWPLLAEDAIEIYNMTVQICIIHTNGASRPLVFALREQSVPLLPMSALGKISRAKMRSQFEGGVFDEDVKFYCQILDRRTREMKMLRKHLGQHQLDKKRQSLNEAELQLLTDIVQTISTTSSSNSDNIDLYNEIGLDTSLFDLGFTSMDLIRLKHHIDTRMGITVPVIVLMKHATARSLSAVLVSLASDKNSNVDNYDQRKKFLSCDYDPVVTFRSGGTKQPLWLVHPGVGEVLVFVGLAQHLSDDDRPLYALRARGFELGQTPFRSISEIVENYLAAIRRHQPRGPYALAGYSYGTMIAFEIAKRLDVKNDAASKVQFLGSFNLPPHIKLRMRQLNWNICLLHLTYFLGLITKANTDKDELSFAATSRSEALAQILGIVDQHRMDELGLCEQGLTRWANVAYGLQSMAVNYEPEGEVSAIDVFHATPLKVAAASREEWVNDHLGRWRDFCKTEPIFHEVDGEHYTMIGKDHVLGFSIKLKAALESRGL